MRKIRNPTEEEAIDILSKYSKEPAGDKQLKEKVKKIWRPARGYDPFTCWNKFRFIRQVCYKESI